MKRSKKVKLVVGFTNNKIELYKICHGVNAGSKGEKVQSK